LAAFLIGGSSVFSQPREWSRGRWSRHFNFNSAQDIAIDVTRSDWKCTLVSDDSPARQWPKALRIGLKYVAGLQETTAMRLVQARSEQPFSSVGDLWRRVHPSTQELTTLASIGALSELGIGRRGAQWLASAFGQNGHDLYRSTEPELEENPLDDMSAFERLAEDFRGTTVTTGPHPLSFYRRLLRQRGIVRAADLCRVSDGRRAQVAGSVIVRQRPGTAKGFFFITLEDETGFANAIVTPKVFAANRSLLTGSAALIIEGVVQSQDHVVSIKADRFCSLDNMQRIPSRDFH